ncbi:TraR/DksA family transcriptional regulator [Thiogranum longum]
MLTEKQIGDLKNTLNERFFEVLEQIRQELLASDNERYIELAGQVHDREEESVADVLVDVQLASIDRHVQEVRDIDAALSRIAVGSYGVCVDCENAIALDRLSVYPTAKRCRPCQAEYEARQAHITTPSL